MIIFFLKLHIRLKENDHETRNNEHSIFRSENKTAEKWRGSNPNEDAFIIAGSKKPPIFVSLTIIRL